MAERRSGRALLFLFYAALLASAVSDIAAANRVAKRDDIVAVLTCRAGMESRIAAGRASRLVWTSHTLTGYIEQKSIGASFLK